MNRSLLSILWRVRGIRPGRVVMLGRQCGMSRRLFPRAGVAAKGGRCGVRCGGTVRCGRAKRCCRSKRRRRIDRRGHGIFAVPAPGRGLTGSIVRVGRHERGFAVVNIVVGSVGSGMVVAGIVEVMGQGTSFLGWSFQIVHGGNHLLIFRIATAVPNNAGSMMVVVRTVNVIVVVVGSSGRSIHFINTIAMLVVVFILRAKSLQGNGIVEELLLLIVHSIIAIILHIINHQPLQQFSRQCRAALDSLLLMLLLLRIVVIVFGGG
mmetsp:Transcript_68/g.129  ORF Transcript_68/g.129 Transcript_68/m.129 type:complete len:264 (-) Transcript_68:149-940(-)